MNSIIAFIKHHPLITFFILAYALSWWLAPLGGGNLPFGPLLAALIVVPLVDGKSGLKTWWSFITRWRGGLGWYVTAVVLVFAMNFAAAALTVLLGVSFPAADTIEGGRSCSLAFPSTSFLLHLAKRRAGAVSPCRASRRNTQPSQPA